MSNKPNIPDGLNAKQTKLYLMAVKRHPDLMSLPGRSWQQCFECAPPEIGGLIFWYNTPDTSTHIEMLKKTRKQKERKMKCRKNAL